MHFGSFSVSSGSPLSPSITFIDDPDSGFCLLSPGVIGIIINGIEVARITSAGVVATV